MRIQPALDAHTHTRLVWLRHEVRLHARLTSKSVWCSMTTLSGHGPHARPVCNAGALFSVRIDSQPQSV
jgi:hypothetical protein